MSWKFGESPEPYELRFRNAKYALVLVMGGDCDLGVHLDGDFAEMTRAVGPDVAALVLVDYPEPEEDEERPKTARVLEVLPSVTKPVEFLPEINTGDPRPLSDFLARALVSFSEETRIALGFWGHGHGVFKDYDPEEVVLSREIRFGALGAPVSEAVMESPAAVKRVLSRSMLPDATSENSLTNREASSALAAAFARAGRTEPVDILFFDTCMNGSVEVFTELRVFAKTFVASSLGVPGTGWDYEEWIKQTRARAPETAEDWAILSAAVFGITYDQRLGKEAAQMGAFSTSTDLVERFGELVDELRKHDERGVSLAEVAARKSEHTVFGENVDLGQLLAWITKLTDEQRVNDLVGRCWEAYREATLALTLAPPKRERLTGMTIWCPVLGDTFDVGRYYRSLEFERVTGWLDFLESGLKPDPEGLPIYTMCGLWGLELVEAGSVETCFVNGKKSELWLAIPERAEEFSGGLVEGKYVFTGGTGEVHFRNYVVLREFARKLMRLREGDEFEALRGCCESGWVIGGAVCGEIYEELLAYREAFWEAYPEEGFDLEIYGQMLTAMRRASKDDGVLVFYLME